ncbi:hypothetical protein ABZP36_003339 [Zizania latifolia]
MTREKNAHKGDGFHAPDSSQPSTSSKQTAGCSSSPRWIPWTAPFWLTLSANQNFEFLIIPLAAAFNSPFPLLPFLLFEPVAVAILAKICDLDVVALPGV